MNSQLCVQIINKAEFIVGIVTQERKHGICQHGLPFRTPCGETPTNTAVNY